MVIKAPTKIEHPLFRAELEYIPFEEAERSGRTSENEPDDADIRERLKGNVIEVGKPESYNLKEMYEIQGMKPPVKIQMLFKKYDFWLIEAPFSFMPSYNTHFEQARILMKMESFSSDIEKPIVHDAYPNNISEEKKVKHKVGIELGLKFVEFIEPKFQYVDEIEFTKLEPVIEVAGIGTSKPIWEFRKKALSNYKDAKTLYTIVKSPHGTKGMSVKFLLNVKVPTILGLKLIGSGVDEKKYQYEMKF